MTKNVVIYITGLHISDEEERIEQVYSGSYFNKDGKHYIFYEERVDSDKTVKNSIRINEGVVSITKKGLFEYQLIFEELKSNVSYYGTPIGRLEAEIYTDSIHTKEEEDSISVHIKYELKIDKVHMSDCEVDIKICSE